MTLESIRAVTTRLDGVTSTRSTMPTLVPRYITLSRSLSPPTWEKATLTGTRWRPDSTSTPEMTMVK